MSTERKQFLAQWAPLLVAFAGQLVFLGVVWGELKGEVKNLREADAAVRTELMPLPERMRIFVPRTEYEIQHKNLRSEVEIKLQAVKEQTDTIKIMLRELNDKIDRLGSRGGSAKINLEDSAVTQSN